MELDLSGKHALVCGGSGGIGKAAAFELARLGADVTVLARRENVLRDVVASLPRSHDTQQHGWITADVADTAVLRAKVEAVVSARPVQILVHNSGGPAGGVLSQAAPETLLHTFNQHLIAGHVLLQALLPGMRMAHYGRVINVISTSVKEPLPGLGVSNTIRASVAAWAKTLASELAPEGITVNNVLPGLTNTDRLHGLISSAAQRGNLSNEQAAASLRATIPAGRFARAEETAAAIAFLASPAAGYINGINLPVDGGRTASL